MTKVLTLPSPRQQAGRMSLPEQEVVADSAARAVLMQAASQMRGDLHGQIVFFLANYRIGSLRGRARPVSFTTNTRYREGLSAFVNCLGALNVAPPSLMDYTVKHMRMCIAAWERNGLSSSTLTNRYTVIRRLYQWVGKLVVPELREMLEDPDNARRSFVAKKPLDWDSAGVDFESLMAEVQKTCRYTAMQLRLERGFGLRSQEALSLKPAESDQHGVLVITRGTKGGKGRVVPIRTPEQRALLGEAKALANRRTGLLQRYGLSAEKARSHYYYVLRKHGITRSEMGVTPHGLRHGYAHKRYEEETGASAPVLSGGRALPQDDEAARLTISSELGHVRKSISSAYVGAVRRMAKHREERLSALAKALASPSLRSSLEWMAAELKLHGYKVCLYVLGPDAVGESVAWARPLAVGVQLRLLNSKVTGAGGLEPTALLPVGEAFLRVQMLGQGPLFMAVQRSVVFVNLPLAAQDGERLEIPF